MILDGLDVVPKYIKKELLQVDPSYNRQFRPGEKFKRMVNEWSSVVCNALLVGERSNGTFWIVDGQHRWNAALKRPDIEKLHCMVFKSTGANMEAEAFLRANRDRVNVPSHDQFRSSVQWKDPVALELDGIANKYGYVFKKGTSPNVIDFVGTVYDRCNSGRFRKRRAKAINAFDAMLLTFHEKRDHLIADIYLGFYEIYMKDRGYGDISGLDDVSKRKLQQASMLDIKRAINDAKLGLGSQGSRAQAIGLLKIANAGRIKKCRVVLPEDKDVS